MFVGHCKAVGFSFFELFETVDSGDHFVLSNNVEQCNSPFRKWTYAPCSQKDQTRNRRWEDIVILMVLARFAEVYSDENQLCLKINLLFWFSKETFAFYWMEIID